MFPRNFGSGIVGRLPVNFYDGDRNFEQSDRTQPRSPTCSTIASTTISASTRRALPAHRRRLRAASTRAFNSTTSLANARDLTSGPFISRSRIANQVSIDAYTVDNYFEAKFDTGILAHTALLGVDHQTFQTRTLSSPFPTTPALNALAPNYDQNFSVPAFTSEANITAAQTGVYLQDQIKLDRLVLTLGGRYDDVAGRPARPAPSPPAPSRFRTCPPTR